MEIRQLNVQIPKELYEKIDNQAKKESVQKRRIVTDILEAHFGGKE